MRLLHVDANATIVRVCKTVLVAVVTLIMTLIALGNVMDYPANDAFVHHVLAMDTVFPNSHLKWRAITDPRLQTAAYSIIIGWEIACAAVCGAGAVELARNARFDAAGTSLAPIGLTMVMLLFGAGFLAVGGEWFLMWQSTTWNGEASALRYFSVAGITLLIVLAPDGAIARRMEQEP